MSKLLYSMVWKFVSLQNLYFEILMPKVMMGVFVMSVEPSWMRLAFLY